MKVGVLAASVFPTRTDTKLAYGGGEKATGYFCKGLAKYADVTLFAPKGSEVEGVKLVETIDPPMKWAEDAEKRAFEIYQHKLAEYSLVVSWTHDYTEFLRREIPFVKQMVGLQTKMVGIINKPRLVALSKFHQRVTWERFRKESRIIPHCIDFSDYALGGGPAEKTDPDALIFGLQAQHKGHLEAGKALLVAGANFRVVGESKFVPNLMYPAILKNEFGERVSGSIPEEEKRALFGKAGCIILNSFEGEAFSMVALEAFASGTPVLMRRLGCAEEMVQEGVTGFTFNEESELPALVEKAQKLDRGAIRAAGMERYDMKPVCAKYYELLESAVNDNEWW